MLCNLVSDCTGGFYFTVCTGGFYFPIAFCDNPQSDIFVRFASENIRLRISSGMWLLYEPVLSLLLSAAAGKIPPFLIQKQKIIR
ncbi:hypothetical protein [Methanolapillus millepedarum]|uniref:Uncharacterized protein n=1 Tax=Methanolapillus millepedarum TaxID=3028296 RepID=A0AA96VE55_9EURY|nr:hypothetical protein MsAc7_05240 [Methanosarcinaceae archaeon Ac7]